MSTHTIEQWGNWINVLVRKWLRAFLFWISVGYVHATHVTVNLEQLQELKLTVSFHFSDHDRCFRESAGTVTIDQMLGRTWEQQWLSRRSAPSFYKWTDVSGFAFLEFQWQQMYSEQKFSKNPVSAKCSTTSIPKLKVPLPFYVHTYFSSSLFWEC